MKRILICFIGLAIVFTTPAYADTEGYMPKEEDSPQSLEAFTDEVKEETKKELGDIVPDDVKEKMEDYKLDTLEEDSFLGFGITDFFSVVFDYLKEYYKTPFTLFATITFIILLTALIQGFQGDFLNEQLKKVLSYVSVVAVLAVLIGPLLKLIDGMSDTIHTANTFLVSFTPIFASVIAVSGKTASALTYSSLLFMLNQFVAFIVKSILVPLVSVFLAFSVAESTSTSIDLSSITQGIKKFVTTSLSVLMTIFVAFLSLQTIVANAGDTVSLKAGKFIVGNFVPIIGGALSDAFSSVYSCMGLIKGLVGGFGIVVIVLTFLPPLVQFAMTYLGLYLAKIISDLLGIKSISKLLDSVCSCLSIMLAVIVCFAFLMIISVTIILIVGAVV